MKEQMDRLTRSSSVSLSRGSVPDSQASHLQVLSPQPLHPLKTTFCFLLFPFLIPLAFVSLCIQQPLLDDGQLMIPTWRFHLPGSVEPHYEPFLAPWHHQGVNRAAVCWNSSAFAAIPTGHPSPSQFGFPGLSTLVKCIKENPMVPEFMRRAACGL